MTVKTSLGPKDDDGDRNKYLDLEYKQRPTDWRAPKSASATNPAPKSGKDKYKSIHPDSQFMWRNRSN